MATCKYLLSKLSIMEAGSGGEAPAAWHPPAPHFWSAWVGGRCWKSCILHCCRGSQLPTGLSPGGQISGPPLGHGPLSNHYRWISMGLHAYPWISMHISMDILGYLWKSLEIHGSPWMSTDIRGYQWISMDIHRYQWIPMDIFMDIMKNAWGAGVRQAAGPSPPDPAFIIYNFERWYLHVAVCNRCDKVRKCTVGT